MYIIKKHYEATDKSINFKNETKDYYYGTNEHLLSQPNIFPSEWEIKEHGYKTFFGAKKGLKLQKYLCETETARGFWNVSCELIEV